MPAQKGRDLLLKLDADATGTFQTVAGLRATRIAFNADTVDVTHRESAGRWRELLAGAGVRSASLSGAGLFKDSAADAATRSLFFDGTIARWQAVIPDFGIIEGPFQIASLEYAGDHDGAATYDLSLASAGELTFTPA